MYNFFTKPNSEQNGFYYICDSDYNHIKNVLRLRIGEQIYVSCDGKSDLCEIHSFTDDTVIVKIIKQKAIDTSLPINLTLFQGLPKAEKLLYLLPRQTYILLELVYYRLVNKQKQFCL